jgi:hypothetical protein
MKSDHRPGGQLTSWVEGYLRAVTGAKVPTLAIACPQELDRILLDGSLDSLQGVDQYLLVVHATQPAIVPIVYLSTAAGLGIYLGEVIRRGSPSAEYRWGRAHELPPGITPQVPATAALSDLLLLGQGSGGVVWPAEAIGRRIRSGAQAPSVYGFAVDAIRQAWIRGTG